MDRLADLEAGQVDQDFVWNEIGRAIEIDLVTHDVEHATLLEAGRGLMILEVHRDFDMDAGVLAKTQEIHMADEVAHRLELDVARNGAHHRTIDFEID